MRFGVLAVVVAVLVAVVVAVAAVMTVVVVALAVVVVSLRMILCLQIVRFPCLAKRRYGPTDGCTYGRTDLRTDRPSYRDTRTHLNAFSKRNF